MKRLEKRWFDFLERLSGVLSLDLPYFVKNHFYLLSATLVDIATGLVLSVLFAHFVDKTTYGQYALLFSFISALSVTKLLGLQAILPYAISQGNEKIYLLSQKLSFLISLLGSLILVIIAFYYLQPNKPGIASAIFLAACFFPFTASLTLHLQYLHAKKQFSLISLISIIQSIVPNFIIVLAIIFSPSLFWLMFAALVPQSLLNIYFSYQTQKKVLANKFSSKTDLAYGLKLSVLSVALAVSQQIDNILLAKFLGFEKLAIYAFATNIPKHITQFIKNFEALSLPKVITLEKKAIRNDLPGKIFQFMVLSLVLIIGYVILAPFIFRFFYPQYLASVLPSQLYCLQFIFYPIVLVNQSFLKFRQFNESVGYNLVSPIVKIIFFVILIPTYGILGAVIASILGEFFRFVFSLLVFMKLRAPANSAN